jgi:general secretion pathway protein K
VLAARIDTLTPSEANTLVASRKQAYFRDMTTFGTRMEGLTGKKPTADEERHMAVNTKYFIVNGRVRLNRAGLSVHALIWRDLNTAKVVWVRED